MSQDEGLSHTKTRPVTLERQFSEAFGKTWRNIGHEMTNGHSENRATFERKTWYLGRGEWSKEEGLETWNWVRNNELTSEDWACGFPAVTGGAKSSKICTKPPDLCSGVLQKWMARKWKTYTTVWMAGGKMNWKESRRLMGKISSLETYDWTETQIKYYLLIQCLSLEI